MASEPKLPRLGGCPGRRLLGRGSRANALDRLAALGDPESVQPRKVIGVLNLGLLVGDHPVAATPATEGPADLAIALLELLRFEDRGEQQNDR
jgi:hypothetical protein